MKLTGIIVLVLGIVFTIFTTVTYFTQEKVVEIGSLKVTKEEPHTIGWSPVVGIAAMGIGAALLLQSRKK